MKPLTPASPHVIIMVGIPGAGKSAFAEKFADTFQTPILNRTKLQKELQINDDQVDNLVETILKEFMKTNRTIVLEGGFDDKKHRAELIKYFTKLGYRPLVVWVQTDTIEARRRATKAYPQGSGLSSDEFDNIVKNFHAPQIQERAIVISGKHTYTTQLKIVLKQIATNTQQKSATNTNARSAQHQAHGVKQTSPQQQAATPAQQQSSPVQSPPRGRGIIIR